MLTLLLLIGLSSSVGLGEQPPGVVGQALVYGYRWQAQTTFDTMDKATGAGWLAGQSVDVDLGSGLLVGAEYRYRNGGAWAKHTGWLRAGYATAWGQNVVQVIGRAAVVGDTTDEGAIQVEYRRYAGRWVFTTTQGIEVYFQPDARWGYYMMASVGLVI